MPKPSPFFDGIGDIKAPQEVPSFLFDFINDAGLTIGSMLLNALVSPEGGSAPQFNLFVPNIENIMNDDDTELDIIP